MRNGTRLLTPDDPQLMARATVVTDLTHQALDARAGTRFAFAANPTEKEHA